MKHNSYLFLATISVLILIYLLYLNKQSTEGFGTPASPDMSGLLAGLSDISRMMIYMNKAHLPATEFNIWSCDKHTGRTVRGETININCEDPNANCTTYNEGIQTCRYEPLPSSIWNDDNKYTLSELENNVDNDNIQDVSVYIPPTINTCKYGCTFQPSINATLLGGKLWSCSPNNRVPGNTNINDSSDICNTDLDCIWCDETGFTPINTNTEAENDTI